MERRDLQETKRALGGGGACNKNKVKQQQGVQATVIT